MDEKELLETYNRLFSKSDYEQYRGSLPRPTYTLTSKRWEKYRDVLVKVNQKAADEFRDDCFKLSGKFKGVGLGLIPRDDIIELAYEIATKYGEASATASALIYDEIAALQKVDIENAIPAPTATYDETAKMVNGILKKSENVDMLASGVSRLVKQAGADTTLQNAHRDRKLKGSKKRHSGARVAWVPSGDTCPYCIALASQGWKQQTEWAAKNHAKHIHANCDCMYMVRFNNDLTYEGYDPDYYTDMINKQAREQGLIKENETVAEKYKGRGQELNESVINAMRREDYKENSEKILEQKANAYEKRKELNNSKAEETKVN